MQQSGLLPAKIHAYLLTTRRTSCGWDGRAIPNGGLRATDRFQYDQVLS